MVREVMEGVAPELRMPLRVRLTAGPSYGQLEKLVLEAAPAPEDPAPASAEAALNQVAEEAPPQSSAGGGEPEALAC